jgi:hypothetical protein
LRKRQVRARYGDCCDRTIERAVIDGRLPPPEFPFANKIPFWDEDTLERHERTVVLTKKAPMGNLSRLFQELATTTDDAVREKLLAVIQDIVAETD